MRTPIVIDPASSEIDQKVQSTIDDKKDAVVRGIETAASTLRESAESLPGGERVVSTAFAAADAMETVAGYLDDRDMKDILSDMRQILRKHPAAILLTAAALGFLLSRAFSRP